MPTAAIEIKELSKRLIEAATMDVVKSASAVHLKYVSDSAKGISRVREGDGFAYFDGNRKVKDNATLERIKKLVIPPAWEKVWICRDENGHLQATGIDVKGRKQYKYHASWNSIRSATKFYRLHEFGKHLPAMRVELQKHLSLPGYPKEKILALVVSLLERTNIRIGNGFYEKLYGSFGLTTLKNNHVKIDGSKMTFSFTGKKSVKHLVSIRSKRLSKIVQACKDIPGKDLFEFIDENGQVHSIESGMVNAYIHSVTGNDFSAKDFRTWAGTTQALLALSDVGSFNTITEFREKCVKVFDHVACSLGNTRSVCKKYYVHPLIIDLYEKKELTPYLEEMKSIRKDEQTGLNPEEIILLKILEKNKDRLG